MTDDIDKLGPWSLQKLQLLEKYLRAYAIILNRAKSKGIRKIHYIDAFAGSVTPMDRETQQYIDGSPRVALQIKPSFDKFWFIDIKPTRLNKLLSLKTEFPNKNIEVKRGNCNDILTKKILPLLPYESFERAFVFIDPYGLHADWETIEALAARKTCDILVNFSLSPINRLLPKNCSRPDLQKTNSISRVFGNDDWVSKVYSSDWCCLPGMPESTERMANPAIIVAKAYLERIKEIYPHISRAALLRNTKGSPLYILFLASHHKEGAKIANEIIDKQGLEILPPQPLHVR